MAAVNSQTDNTTTIRPCAQCGLSVECASLLLACDHNLCLLCAASSLQRPESSGPVVQCRTCRTVTEVDVSAAQYLDNLRPDSARTTASGIGGASIASTATKHPATPPLSPQFSEPRALRANTQMAQPVPKLVQAQGFSSLAPLQAPSGASQLHAWPKPTQVGYSSACGSAVAPSVGLGGPSPPMVPPLLSAPLKGERSATAASAGVPGQTPLLRPPRPVSVCGQCEEQPAELSCEQCAEFFCQPCAALIHQRGKMAEHQLRRHDGAFRSSDSVDGFSESGGDQRWASAMHVRGSAFSTPPRPGGGMAAVVAAGNANEPRLLARRFLCCPAHPEEPLQYFCLQCQTDCVCAECVLNGIHKGHDVLNVREATRGLPERIASLASSVRTRAEEFAGIAEQADHGRREIADIVTRGRQEIQREFEQLAAVLRQEEDALLDEVDRCSADVSEILGVKDEAHVREAQTMLQRSHQAGDATQALDWYAKLKKAVAAPLPQCPSVGGEDPVAPLKAQLRRGFDGRLAGIAEVAKRIAELNQFEVPRLMELSSDPSRVTAGPALLL